MKKICATLALLITFAVPVFATQRASDDTLYQVSTIDGLMAGLYDGQITLGELKNHGDTGIGTFDRLDGEMIVVDGKVYRISSDGNAKVVDDATTTPFASITHFDKDQSTVVEGIDFTGLTKLMDVFAPESNLFCVIRIDGEFEYLKTRSVPAQSKPYKKLLDVVAKQPTFEFDNVKGTIIGLRCPYFVKGMNVPGYHFHFITADKTHGGHVLACRITKATVTVDVTPNFSMVLPTTGSFPQMDFQTTEADVNKAEK